MLKIIHRINKISELKKVPLQYGVEVDIRTYNNQLILNHEPFQDGDKLDEYLAEFKNAFIILEIKEEGIEKEVIKLCEKYGIEDYFLLSVSFPFIYLLSKQGIRKMAARFSEFEDINTCLTMKHKIEWIWVDTFENNPLSAENYRLLKDAGFKICIVCPERWGRSTDISEYTNYFKSSDIRLDAVMTSYKHVNDWFN
ncbi:MAG: hypothetical protein WC471_04985 [Candidatus Woesearchaeota archaeon]